MDIYDCGWLVCYNNSTNCNLKVQVKTGVFFLSCHFLSQFRSDDMFGI